MAVPLLACVVISTLLLADVTATAETTTVKVTTTPVYPKIPRGQTSKDFQVLVRVEAPPAAETRRVPVDLVAVLDVSGSMNDPVAPPPGSKATRLDLLKTAMKFVIIRNLDDTDRLAVVAFNDGPSNEYGNGLLDMSGDGRRNAGRRVERLKAGGGTALIPALEEAVKILDGRANDGRNRVGFIILLTDGEDTSGFRWSEVHGALISEYPVHTFGFGAGHDPKPLLAIAQASRGGTYSFVDVDKLHQITEAIAVVLGGLTTVAAVDTRVTLESADHQHGGVRIKRVESGGYESRVTCSGSSGEIDVGVLYASEVKSFVVHLHVPAAASPSVVLGGCSFAICDHPHHQQQLLAVSYSYSHAPGTPAISVEGHGLFVQRPEVVVGQQAPSPAVLQHIVHFEMLEIVASFVDGEINDYLSLANALQSKWEEFRRAHQFWVGVELAVLERDVDAMVTGLKHGGGGAGGAAAGVAFVYSWVSSRHMQRATTMGWPDKVAAEFLTPAMLRMLEEARKFTITVGVEQAAVYTDGSHHGCACVDLEKIIDQRLELWARVKREVPLMYQPSGEEVAAGETSHTHHLAAVFRAASLEAIDRAMHHDMYLAVVHARSQK